MKPYGKKPSRTHIEGHQNCGICHPPQKNLKKRARAEAKKIVEKEKLDKDSKET